MIIFKIIMAFFSLYYFFKLISYIEKCNITKDINTGHIHEKWSLKAFKIGRIATIAIAAPEYILYQSTITPRYKVLFFTIFTLGVLLRIAAIRTLGRHWSFHIETSTNHKVITNGIYRHIKHPAYLGNIFIPALYASFGIFYTSLISTLLIIVFYIYRSSYENKLLCTYSNIGVNLEPNWQR